jgi:MerR family transcriptional regulator, mercuric resistance operon regulatory protein
MVQSQAVKPLTIGEFAAAGEVGIETVRYYQRRNLLRTPAKGAGIRHYGPDDVRRLRFIRQAQAAGFPLTEISELLELDAGEHRDRAFELAQARIKALDLKIAELKRARNSLRRLARACGEGSSGPCPILSSFDV